MKKRALAALTIANNQNEQLLDNGLAALVEIVQSAMSSIATIDPESAISVIKQLNSQLKSIENLIEERESDTIKQLNAIVASMPNSINLEDDEKGSGNSTLN